MDRSEYSANILITETPQLRYVTMRPRAFVDKNKKTFWGYLFFWM